MIVALVLTITLMCVIPAAVWASSPQGSSSAERARRLVRGFTLFDTIVVFMAMGAILVWLFAPQIVRAAGPSEQAEAAGRYDVFAAVLAVSVGSMSAAYAVTSIGSAAVGAIAERPEIFGSVLVLAGLAEGIAIYGLIIAFMILAG
ncbi:MAG: ATP synthase subunit C [Chloroflexota bacterium]|nr:ATP synthase subunit C [Chloroflexota bacterium]